MDVFLNTRGFIQKIISMSSNEIKKLVDIFLKKNKLEKGLLSVEIEKVWHDLMSNGIANYTNDVSLKNKTLYIKLSSPALKEELSYGKVKLIKLINDRFKKNVVEKIILS